MALTEQQMHENAGWLVNTIQGLLGCGCCGEEDLDVDTLNAVIELAQGLPKIKVIKRVTKRVPSVVEFEQ